MSHRKTAGILIGGVLLILLGAALLLVNLGYVRIDWRLTVKLVLPALFLLFGLFRLVQHYSLRPDPQQPAPLRYRLLSGLFWTALGIVLILDVYDQVDSVSFIGYYWPALFILFGLAKIGDYYRFGGNVRLQTSEVFGLVFIVFFGITCRLFAESHWPLVRDWLEDEMAVEMPEGWAGNRFLFENAEEIDPQGANSLVVEHRYGPVIVEPAGNSRIEATLLKRVHASDRDTARRVAESLLLLHRIRDSALVLSTNREELGESGKQVSTELRVAVPRDLPVTIRNQFGDVTCRRLGAAVTVANEYGKIEVQEIMAPVQVTGAYEAIRLRQIRGTVQATNRRASVLAQQVTGDAELATDYERLEAERIDGNLSARNHYGDVVVRRVSGDAVIRAPGSQVRVSNVAGSLRVEQSYRPLRVEDVGGDAQIESSHAEVQLSNVAGKAGLAVKHGKITARDVGGGLSVQGLVSELDLRDIRGPLTVVSTMRPIHIQGCGGSVTVENEYGEVFIDCPQPPRGNIRVRNRNAAIRLRLPEQGPFTLAAQVEGGKIVSDFGEEPELTAAGGAFLRTSVGKNGPLVEVQTTYANISVEKR
ncbi:MAG: hypothetical protein Kow00109_16360 [Acidobacteriota bacterium]